MRFAAVTLAALLMPLWGQEMRMPANLDKLSQKAEKSVDVTLDAGMLRLAARFLSDQDVDQAKAKKLVAGLEGVYVRSFEFAEEGDYNKADVDAIRAQLPAPAWSRIVGVKSKHRGDDVDVYFKTGADGQFAGIVVIAAKARELTVVNVMGNLDPAKLADLGGQFHIPRLAFASRVHHEQDEPEPK